MLDSVPSEMHLVGPSDIKILPYTNKAPTVPLSKGGPKALPSNIRLGSKKFARDKHTSLFCHSVSDEWTQFYNIYSRGL
jgi:hypothetical protein